MFSFFKHNEDLAKLSGMWGCIRAEHDGKEFPAIGLIFFEPDGDYVMLWNLLTVEQGTDRLYPAKTPKHIDVTIKEDLDLVTNKPDRKGLVMRGIYEIKEDTFTACYGRNSQLRPGEFSSSDEGYLYVWKRVPGITFGKIVMSSEPAPDRPKKGPPLLTRPFIHKTSSWSHPIPPELQNVCRDIRAEAPSLFESLDNGGREPVPTRPDISPATRSLIEKHRQLMQFLPDWLLTAISASDEKDGF